ncbi:hypothetical protein [Actinophytocola sp.]|uniref:hypothetical protein n=1 Tax=Actinophytocola sp. TaxID=1872138 RepID=UPI002D373309|nr:hypothetical protein [Actinophytocola sp.]HYQ68670.1 hypothetical protein [Actinophytocola sp.]
MLEHRAPSVVDAIRAALAELAMTGNGDAMANQLAYLSRMLRRYPPAVPSHLAQTYRWLIAKIDVLHELIVVRSSPRLVRLVNELARELLLGLDGAPRHALRHVDPDGGNVGEPLAWPQPTWPVRMPSPESPRLRAGAEHWRPA